MVPGSARGLTFTEAEAMAAQIGFPVMIKAAAGGGGKGMRMVSKAADLKSVLKLLRAKRSDRSTMTRSIWKNSLRTRATLRSRCSATNMAM